jgi:hypothetical protein
MVVANIGFVPSITSNVFFLFIFPFPFQGTSIII